MITLDAKIRHVLSRLRDERGLGSRTLLAREAAALIEQLDAMRIKAALNPQEARWLANAERQREEIDKSEVEFFEKLCASPAEMSEWHSIETAPKDGRVIDLTWMENGEPQEIWPMQWGHIQRNGLFPENIGMWIATNGSVTWNGESDNGGPTHWRTALAPFEK